VIEQIGAFLGAVGGILWLDANTIRALQSAPNGLTFALWILLLGTLSDVIGDSPLLFINRMSPGRFWVALAIELVLSLVRLAIWFVSFWVLVLVLNRSVSLTNIVLVVGIGYAPMLLSLFVVIPSVGPLIGRVLHAWTLVTILASMAVAVGASPWEIVAPGAVAVLLILAVRRWSDRVSVAVLSGISRRLVGVDVMQRTRAMDPKLVMATRASHTVGRAV
jgi:hypothetical protein